MARPQLLDHEIIMDERAFLAAALDTSGLSSGNYLNGFCMILRIYEIPLGKGREAYPLRQTFQAAHDACKEQRWVVEKLHHEGGNFRLEFYIT